MHSLLLPEVVSEQEVDTSPEKRSNEAEVMTSEESDADSEATEECSDYCKSQFRKLFQFI